MGHSGCSDACQRVEGAPLFGLVYLIGAEWDETGFNYDPPRNSEVPAVPAETLLDSKRQDVITVQMDPDNMTRARGRVIIFYTR